MEPFDNLFVDTNRSIHKEVTTMKKLIAMVLCLVLALSMVGCSNSANKTETISFHDKTFNKADLSPETLNWLIQYNNLSEEEQLAISFIPSDLYELCGYENAIEEVGSTEAQPGGTPVEEAFDITVSYANWTEDSAINIRALNTNKMALSNVLHLPIYKFSTLEELEKFKLDFGEVLAMDSGYNEVPSFNDVTADYDETFFNENDLMLVYVSANSGSYRFGVNSVFCNGNSFCIHIEQLNNPEVGTADMAGWFITVAVPSSMVANCSEFDADLNNIEN